MPYLSAGPSAGSRNVWEPFPIVHLPYSSLGALDVTVHIAHRDPSHATIRASTLRVVGWRGPLSSSATTAVEITGHHIG